MLGTHTATHTLTALSCFIPESSRTQLLLRARESKNGLYSLLSGDSLWKLSSVILRLLFTNGSTSDSSCDPISVHLKLVARPSWGRQEFLAHTHVQIRQRKEQKQRYEVFHIPPRCSAHSLGPEWGREHSLQGLKEPRSLSPGRGLKSPSSLVIIIIFFNIQ